MHILRKIPRINSLRLFLSPIGNFIAISDFNTKKLQLNLLRCMVEDNSSFFVLFATYTKPGRHRPALFSHFHLFNSCVLCPVCVTCNYLIHRLLVNDRPLRKNDFLFVFNGVNRAFFPFTTSIFAVALGKICIALNLIPIRMHNFKLGIITEL